MKSGDEAERDQLWARVFATVEFRDVLADLQARGLEVIRIAEIEERVGRARESWRTGKGDVRGS